jgi:outer membrane immunogenic protein
MVSTLSHPRTLPLTLTSLLLLSFSLPVFAAENSTWQGPYVGVYLGEGFGSHRTSTDAGTVVTDADTDSITSYFVTSDDINAVNNAGRLNKNPNAVIAGIEAGQNWAWKKLVYGVALDYGTLPLSSSNNVNNMTYPDNSDQYSIHTTMRTNWLFTLRGRLGYQTLLHWPTLIYATGGMALTQLKVSNDFSDNSSFAGAGESYNNSNEIGWTLGAGIELALSNHLSADLEYSHIGLPSVRTTGSISNTQGGFGIPTNSMTNPFSTTGQFQANLLKVGLKYRF